jgi:hypothetical protein
VCELERAGRARGAAAAAGDGEASGRATRHARRARGWGVRHVAAWGPRVAVRARDTVDVAPGGAGRVRGVPRGVRGACMHPMHGPVSHVRTRSPALQLQLRALRPAASPPLSLLRAGHARDAPLELRSDRDNAGRRSQVLFKSGHNPVFSLVLSQQQRSLTFTSPFLRLSSLTLLFLALSRLARKK